MEKIIKGSYCLIVGPTPEGKWKGSYYAYDYEHIYTRDTREEVIREFEEEIEDIFKRAEERIVEAEKADRRRVLKQDRGEW
jgi:hypothetical protein